MRKLVAGFAASADGYIEAANGGYDWILIDAEINFAEQASRFDTYFFGRRSYEAVQRMGTRPAKNSRNFVFSRTLQSVAGGYFLISSNVAEQVLHLKQQSGKDIALFGGASLLAALLDLQLVDEIQISFIPVLLGQGKPMVGLLQKNVWLRLQNSKTYGNGTVQVHYSVTYKQ